MRIVYATWMTVEYQGRALTAEGVTDRLLSYYFVKDEPGDQIPVYVKTGVASKGKKIK